MKRKTNLFYTKGQDSNFVTFSNYSESLTGNIISTNTKIFPSSFLCVKLNDNLFCEDDETITFRSILSSETYSEYQQNANNEGYLSNEQIETELIDDSIIVDDNIDNIIYDDYYYDDYEELPVYYKLTRSQWKKYFIKQKLAGYYENKLAYMRDYVIDNDNIDIDDYNMYVQPLSFLLPLIQDIGKVTYWGQISEFDYKGTYQDIICYIPSSITQNCSDGIIFTTATPDEEYNVVVSSTLYPDQTHLYNWSSNTTNGYVYKGPSYYENIIPEFDGLTDTDSYHTYQYNITYNNVDISGSNTQYQGDVTFDLIIPLYKEYNTDSNTLISDVEYPLGIWFSGKQINLEYDTVNMTRPSWSLTLSTQFKSFPTTLTYSATSDSNDNSDSVATSYGNFAYILSQNASLLTQIQNLETRLQRMTELENQISKINSYVETNVNSYDQYIKSLTSSNIISRLESIESRLSSIEPEVEVNNQNISRNTTNILTLASSIYETSTSTQKSESTSES